MDYFYNGWVGFLALQKQVLGNDIVKPMAR